MSEIKSKTKIKDTDDLSEVCDSKKEPTLVPENESDDLKVMSVETYENKVETSEDKKILLSTETETSKLDDQPQTESENVKIPKEAVKEQASKNSEKQASKNSTEKVEKNSFELKFGTKYTNIIGFVFIIISILLLAQYSYVNFATTALARTILFYSAGIIILVIAEVLNNRGQTVFSIGLTAGSISILFLSTGIAYFYFHIISITTSIVLIVLTASVAFLLSIKYDKQIISVFAIIGAYLPIINLPIMILFNYNKFVIGALLYLLVCSIFSSLLASKKRWNVLSYFSVILNFLSVSIVLAFADIHTNVMFLFTMIYLIATLIFYVSLSLINPVKNNLTLKTNELVLLFMSIAIGAGLCYSQLYAYNMEKYNGIFTIALAILFYYVGSKLKKILDNRKLSDLMYIAALFFAVIAVPMQLSTMYIATTWMIMAIILLWYATHSKTIEFMYAGTVFLVLSTITFFITDISLFKILLGRDSIFFRYTIFTVGSTISAYLYMKNEIKLEKESVLYKNSALMSCFRIFNIFNMLLYIYYVYSALLNDKFSYTVSTSILIVTICAYLYCLLKTKFLSENERPIISNIILWITYIGVFSVNRLVDLNINSSDIIINIVCVAIYNIMLLYVVSKTISQTRILAEKQEAVMNVVLLIILMFSILANKDVNLGVFNTLIFGIIGFICILQGIRTLNTSLRRFGLWVTIISIAKFFMFDLSAQSALQKILSYFLFGLMLISISYLYQKLLQKYEISPSDFDINEQKSDKDTELNQTATLKEHKATEVDSNDVELDDNSDSQN